MTDVPVMPDFDLDLDLPLESEHKNTQLVDNVLIYISGFLMKKLTDKESCTYCFTYLKENKERISCELINFRQLGGLVYPTFDIVTIVNITNKALDVALSKDNICDVLKCSVQLTNEIVSEILSSESTVLEEISLHDKYHRLKMLKTIVFSFISIKGKHLCRSQNIEDSTLIRHRNTKQIIFKHE